MAKTKNVSSSSLEDQLIEKFGNIIVSANYIFDQEPLIVPISPAFDVMLGGGIKFGSFVIPTGPPKSGKTSFAIHMAGKALDAPMPDKYEHPRRIFFFNIEGRLNRRDIEGVASIRKHVQKDPSLLKIIQSEEGNILKAEDYLEIGEQLINAYPGCIFIFDSFSQLCSKQGYEHDWQGKQFRDDVPKLLSMFCKRISNVIPVNQSIVVGITHRIANTGFGFSPWAEASGTKVQYQVDVKLQTKFTKDLKAGDSKIGQIVTWGCSCSPLINGPMDDECESTLLYNYGLDEPRELAEVCTDLGLIEKKGSWYKYNGESIQGLENLRQYIVDSPELYAELNTQFREMMGLPACIYQT